MTLMKELGKWEYLTSLIEESRSGDEHKECPECGKPILHCTCVAWLAHEILRTMSTDKIERRLALGKLAEIDNELNRWHSLQDETLDMYRKCRRAGVDKSVLKMFDMHVRIIADKIVEVAAERKRISEYVQERGWM